MRNDEIYTKIKKNTGKKFLKKSNVHYFQKTGIIPLLLPISHIQLLFQQSFADSDCQKEGQQQKGDDTANCTAMASANNPRRMATNPARFSLAVRVQTDPLDMNNQKIIENEGNRRALLPSMRLFHFECCHADVCRHLVLALQQQKQQQQSAQTMQNADDGDDADQQLKNQPMRSTICRIRVLGNGVGKGPRFDSRFLFPMWFDIF